MTPRLLLVFLAGTVASFAQNGAEDSDFDPVAEAIREFNERRSKQANEVTVVLEPPSPPSSPATAATEVEEKDEVEKEPATETSGGEDAPRQAGRKAGLTVKVEKIQAGNGAIDPAKVKLLAPFPAKPLVQPPSGWRIESSVNAPPLTREVELAPGASITLSIRPHLLTPQTDGATTFAIPEPGYHPMLGYHQSDTVGAILSTSIQKLDEDAKHLGQAIDRLEQLLSALPRPESTPAPADAP